MVCVYYGMLYTSHDLDLLLRRQNYVNMKVWGHYVATAQACRSKLVGGICSKEMSFYGSDWEL